MFRCLHAGDLDAVVCPELVADGGLSHYLLSVHEARSRISGLGRKAHYNPRIIESAVLEGDSTDQHDRREHCSFRFAKRLVRGTAWLRSDVRHVSPLTLCLHHPRNDLDALALAIQPVPCSCRRVARPQTYRSAALWQVRAGSAANCFLAISCDDAVPFAATAQLHPNNIAATRLMFEYIVETARASLMQRFELPSMLHSRSSPRPRVQSLRSAILGLACAFSAFGLPRRTALILETNLRFASVTGYGIVAR